jgi:transposase-like protein
MAQQSLRQYDRDFKLQAIGRANSMGDVKRAAQTLGIREVLLYRWIRSVTRTRRGLFLAGEDGANPAPPSQEAPATARC